MLLNITTTHQPATDLGYLLHKHPDRCQSFEMTFGKAHVFYPESTLQQCTATLLLDIDPVGLVRGQSSGQGTLQQYVNDRPYVASSFMSVAISKVFRTALSGRCKNLPDLAKIKIPLKAHLPVLPCRGGIPLIKNLFEPLEYDIKAETLPLDDFLQDRNSVYLDVTLSNNIRLADLLSHLYVLIPVLDDDKHYWVGDEEIEKLLRHGEGWLNAHPYKEQITQRYLKRRWSLARKALSQLAEEDGRDLEENDSVQDLEEAAIEKPISLNSVVLDAETSSAYPTLNQQRLESVAKTLNEYRVKRVIDLGCDVLHYITAKRLAAGKLTVIDATNVQPESRKPLIALAKKYHCFAVAIAFDLPESICHERNQQRPDRQFGSHVVRNHTRSLKRSLKNLKREGFRFIYKLTSVEEIEAVEVAIQPMWTNRKHERGPFDLIGDVHGCCDELEKLLESLGYVRQEYDGKPDCFWNFPVYIHPQGRKAIFVGDLVDRGNRILDTLKLVHNMLKADSALCILGNHENKLMRKLNGKNVKLNHGLEQTMAEIEAIEPEERDVVSNEINTWLKSLISHYVLDEGKLVVAHAGLREELQGRGSGYVRNFALYGETTGEIDEFGFPVRYQWANEYRGKATVVYGHVPVLEAQWLNNTINIDTGCVFGGKLTALRYPERELVSVNAAKTYCEPLKPLNTETKPKNIQQQRDDVLDIEDVTGKRFIHTNIYGNIAIREDQNIAALEVMSRFAVNPKWLIYLPPTMSPVATSNLPDYLEHPTEAFAYYQQHNIERVICEGAIR